MKIVSATKIADLPGGRSSSNRGQVVQCVVVEQVDCELGEWPNEHVETRYRCRVTNYVQSRPAGEMDKSYCTELRGTLREAREDGRRALAEMD